MKKIKSLAILGTSIALGCSLSVFGFADVILRERLQLEQAEIETF